MFSRKRCALFLLLASLALGATVPRPSPDFAISLNDGRQIHPSEYQGKVVLLAFILTTCPHCQYTVQILAKLQKEYAAQGLQVIASAIEDMASMAVPDFIKRFQPGFPVGFDQREYAETYLEHPVMYRLLMPQVVVIDRKGVIRAQFAGDDKFFEKAEQEKNFRDLLEPLLKEGQAQTAAHKKRAAR
jgi:peroxiredoxin